MEFYTHFFRQGNKVYERYIEDGERKERTVELYPRLFIECAEKTDCQTLYGKYLKDISPSDCDAYKEKKGQIENAGRKCYGYEPLEYDHISDTYGLECPYKSEQILVFTLDIETEVPEDGFPDAEKAENRVNVITIHHSLEDKYYVFAFQNFDVTKELDYIPPAQIVKKIYKDERSMLIGLCDFWQTERPDVLSGWFTSHFDLKYLYYRLKNLGIMYGKKRGENCLSIGGNSSVDKSGNVILKGVSHLDYAKVMQKFGATGERVWSLNAVSADYLGVQKVENPYTNFKDFYTRAWNLFVTYNIRDVELVVRLMRQTKQLELVYSLAYLIGGNFNDVFGTLKPWEIYIQNVLKKENIFLSLDDFSPGEDGSFMGGYVKNPKPGRYEWLVSFDQNSLYPSIIRTWNISPETIVNDPPADLLQYAGKIYTEVPAGLTDLLKKHDLAMTANGQFFRRDKKGILARLCGHVYDQRVETKNAMKSLKKENYAKGIKEDPRIDVLDHKQYALKILLNSLYGALANKYFIFFDFRCAEGITSTGQFIIKRIGEHIGAEIDKVSGKTDDAIVYSDTDSVVGDTSIIVDDKKIAIEDFFDYMQSDVVMSYGDKSVRKPTQDYFTYGVDACGKIAKKKILYAMKHKTKKKLYKITVGDKSVTVTEDHSLIIMRGGNLISVKPHELKDGDEIVLR